MKYDIRVLLITATLFSSCAPPKGPEGGKLRVLTTTGMIADCAANIGGEHVHTEALMGPGVDPHLYKASAGDVKRLASADLVLYNGLHLEAKMGEVLAQMGHKKRTRAVAEVIPETRLLSAGQFGHDPHVWFDVTLWKEVSGSVRDGLIEADPKHKEAFIANHLTYGAKLDQLHKEVISLLATVPENRRVLITAHDAFGYFGRAYGFQVRGLQGVSTVTETGTRDLQNLADFIAERKIPALFIESSVPRRNIEALQAAVASRGFAVAIGGELFSDAMGRAGTEEGTYLGMVRHNARTLAAAFQK